MAHEPASEIPASLVYALRDMLTSPRHVSVEDADCILGELNAIASRGPIPWHPVMQPELPHPYGYAYQAPYPAGV